MKAMAKYAAVLSAAGVLFLSTGPVLAKTTSSAAAFNPIATPDTLAADAAAGALSGAVGGAVGGAVAALFGSPIGIAASAGVGALAGAASGAVTAVAEDLLSGSGRIVIEPSAAITPSTALD